LAFEHPSSGEQIDLTVPPPKDFQMLADTLRRDAASE
jgi:hypothetical protein